MSAPACHQLRSFQDGLLNPASVLRCTCLSLLLLRSCLWCLSLDLDRDLRECLLRLLSLSLDLDLDLRGMLC